MLLFMGDHGPKKDHFLRSTGFFPGLDMMPTLCDIAISHQKERALMDRDESAAWSGSLGQIFLEFLVESLSSQDGC